MKWRNYGQLTRPDGEWVRTTDMISVVGLADNIQSFTLFAQSAEDARKRGLRFGVDIAADPENELTPNARMGFILRRFQGFARQLCN